MLITKAARKIINKRRKVANNKKVDEAENDNREWLSRNSCLNNSAKKSRIFIIGNGPSLKDIDFDLLKCEDLFTVNYISRADDFDKMNIKYHFWADPNFFLPNLEKSRFELMKKVIDHKNKPICFVVSSLDNHIVKELNYNNQIYRYPQLGTRTPLDLEVKLDKTLPGYYNVIAYAITTSIALGYKDIYLLGCEQTNIYEALNTLLNEKYDVNAHGYKIDDKEKELVYKEIMSSPITYQLDCYKKIFEGFELVDKLVKANGVNVVNCTKKTLLKIWPRESLEDVLKF